MIKLVIKERRKPFPGYIAGGGGGAKNTCFGSFTCEILIKRVFLPVQVWIIPTWSFGNEGKATDALSEETVPAAEGVQEGGLRSVIAEMIQQQRSAEAAPERRGGSGRFPTTVAVKAGPPWSKFTPQAATQMQKSRK